VLVARPTIQSAPHMRNQAETTIYQLRLRCKLARLMDLRRPPSLRIHHQIAPLTHMECSVISAVRPIDFVYGRIWVVGRPPHSHLRPSTSSHLSQWLMALLLRLWPPTRQSHATLSVSGILVQPIRAHNFGLLDCGFDERRYV
jgi:hypothetical protein